MKRFTGFFIVGSSLRRVVFDALDSEEANRIALAWGVGVEGESAGVTGGVPLPEAYDAKTACRLLGGISRKTLYRELVVGNLERMPDTRRVLVTRESIERRCRPL